MKKIDLFIKAPTRARFEKLDIVGDVKMMKYLYEQAPNLAKRYFTCEDWVELCRFEKEFATRTELLQNAVDVIASIEDCRQVFMEDKRDEFYKKIMHKAIIFCVSFDDILDTICTFELTNEKLYKKYGKKLVKRAINLMVTPEDVKDFSGIIPIDDEDSLSKFNEKTVSIGVSFDDEEF